MYGVRYGDTWKSSITCLPLPVPTNYFPKVPNLGHHLKEVGMLGGRNASDLLPCFPYAALAVCPDRYLPESSPAIRLPSASRMPHAAFTSTSTCESTTSTVMNLAWAPCYLGTLVCCFLRLSPYSIFITPRQLLINS